MYKFKVNERVKFTEKDDMVYGKIVKIGKRTATIIGDDGFKRELSVKALDGEDW